MANLTITVDEDVLKKARLRALQQGVSVNALLRDYLARYAGAASIPPGGRRESAQSV
jgi:predicted HicB family RNase H-like nuclease